MTEVAPPDVKRRRLSAADSSPQGIRCLAGLPSGILAHAASFLAAPSKALLAVALDENSAVTSNERSSAIVGNQWDTLDFGQIEKEAAENLTDSDIEGVLLCIDAVNNVKRLKLTNCIKITGTCLEPLRGSAVIEQIDLSLIGNESPDLDPEPPISCEHVLPILDSIIAREGCSLMHLQFPSVWRKEPSNDSDFHAFIGRYNEMRRNREAVRCLECNHGLPRNGDEWITTTTRHEEYGIDHRYAIRGITVSEYYGTHLHTCYGCLEHYCRGCDNGQDPLNHVLKECDTCQRYFCNGCVEEMTRCFGCAHSDLAKYICNDCYKYYVCVSCTDGLCSKCVKENWYEILKCDHCNKCVCQLCNEWEEHCEEKYQICGCSQCGLLCRDCALERFRQGQLCEYCIKTSAPLLVGEGVARKQLQDENEQLKVEVEALKRENRELKLLMKKS